MVPAPDVLKPFFDDLVKPMLPSKLGYFNEVVCRGVPMYERDVRPNYEDEMICGAKIVVDPGDTILHIGAGLGVVTVKLAEMVGRDGQVVAFEPSDQRYQYTKETVALNDVDERVELRQQAVGKPVSVDGSMRSASIVSPDKLPPHDALIMDCDGGEIAVLEGYSCKIRGAVIEVHPHLEVDENDVRSCLADLGLEITHRAVEWEKHDIAVLTAQSK